MNEQVIVTEIQKLALNPGDILVVRGPEISHEQILKLQDQISQVVGFNVVIISVGKDHQLGIMRPRRK